jgi:hypothetical protein
VKGDDSPRPWGLEMKRVEANLQRIKRSPLRIRMLHNHALTQCNQTLTCVIK